MKALGSIPLPSPSNRTRCRNTSRYWKQAEGKLPPRKLGKYPLTRKVVLRHKVYRFSCHCARCKRIFAGVRYGMISSAVTTVNSYNHSDRRANTRLEHEGEWYLYTALSCTTINNITPGEDSSFKRVTKMAGRDEWYSGLLKDSDIYIDEVITALEYLRGIPSNSQTQFKKKKKDRYQHHNI